jgi:hypothetical protein
MPGIEGGKLRWLRTVATGSVRRTQYASRIGWWLGEQRAKAQNRRNILCIIAIQNPASECQKIPVA